MPISIPKFFQRAFAQNGGRQDVPVTGDTSGGRASYDVGFPPVTRTPIIAGGIPPFGTDFNGVLYDLSQAIQYLQSGVTFPFDQDFADAIGGYRIKAIVADPIDPTILWQNNNADNTLTPSVPNGWVQVFSAADLLRDPTITDRGAPLLASNAEALSGVNSSKMLTPANKKFADQPFISGNAVMTAIDNKLVLSSVITTLLLEKGDVVQIIAPAIGYSKFHTVESLTGASDIVVNYEHCGARGNGPLKLPDYTGQLTINLVAKWRSASGALGQDWVNVTAFRVGNTPYANSVNRTIHASVSTDAAAAAGAKIIVDGVTASTSAFSNGTDGSADAPIPPGANYTYNNSTIISWTELR